MASGVFSINYLGKLKYPPHRFFSPLTLTPDYTKLQEEASWYIRAPEPERV